MLEHYDKSKYEKGTHSLIEDIEAIFVEGKSNKLFYSCFEEIKHIPILTPLDKNQGSCSCGNIKKLIKKNLKWHAILDGDFNTSKTSLDRVYHLNYYSIENIVLIHHPKFKEIKNELQKLINKKGIKNCFNKRYTISKEKGRSDKFEIIESKKIHPHHQQYLKNNITSSLLYIQHMPVKNIIEAFDSFLTSKIDGHKKREYLRELHDKLNNKSLLNLFPEKNHQHYDKLKKLIKKN